MSSELRLFPLGTVVLPAMVVPLQVFEPRYQRLVADALDTDGRFGIILLHRGSEVGESPLPAEQSRARVGTLVQILEVKKGEGEQSKILVGGERRFRVQEWLDDDPYPRALVEFWDETESSDLSATSSVPELIEQAQAEVRAIGAMLEPSGRQLPLLPELHSDPALASFQLSTAVPLQPFDLQRLLEAPDTRTRLSLLQSLFSEVRAMLRLELESGS